MMSKILARWTTICISGVKSAVSSAADVNYIQLQNEKRWKYPFWHWSEWGSTLLRCFVGLSLRQGLMLDIIDGLGQRTLNGSWISHWMRKILVKCWTSRQGLSSQHFSDLLSAIMPVWTLTASPSNVRQQIGMVVVQKSLSKEARRLIFPSVARQHEV